MGKRRLLPGEHEELRLRPHVLSFGPQFAAAVLPALWGAALWVIFHSAWWDSAESGRWYQVWTFLYGNTAAAFVYLVAGLAVLGAALSVMMIRWRIFFWYLGTALLVAVPTAIWLRDQYALAIPLLLWTLSAPALVWIEAERRSHRFVLTNLRILFEGGFFVHRERQLRYEAVTDLDGHQGPMGRLFGYGTLIPVTQSGFGLGADTSQALVGVGVGGQKAGVGGGIGVAAGGGKEVQVGRARTFHQLTGVYPYKDAKYLLETLVQNATATPYLRQQVALQERMADALDRLDTRGYDELPVFGDST